MPTSNPSTNSTRELLARAKVVDLLRFRTEREPEELPLFARPMPAGPAIIAPFRRLSERELAHRARMLAHLDAARR
jgi:hypothetical protein